VELWGGLECSVVRLGDRWRDQVRETGHHERDTDLQLIADLGIRTLRYPVLWERCTPGEPNACGWEWHDRRIATIQDLGMKPIIGLLHHGAGPSSTHLLDPGLAEGLAAHADQAAQRYSHVKWWTPVNEPLTTARFSCLYGMWHPHLHDERAFLNALVNQCHAALLSMRAIRARIPAARFVHTEDFGHTFATPPLQWQADYDNERRWLSFDLLCGKLDRSHPWRSRLEQAGVSGRVLDELASGEASPDVIGVNHYVTSDRFLDDRQGLYPPHMRSPIGYVNTEAARVFLAEGETGWAARLREIWARYDLPMAITEAHLGCDDPAEQLRWLMQAWTDARVVRSEGADIRAVTAWALFGLVDWNSMLREPQNHYEPGVFDTAHPERGPTLLAHAVRKLTRSGQFAHPALLQPGWWERDDRVFDTLRRA
jgi:beta-glucosidase/6-phospho-beta-glucosidase/beta-galactosidase